ncbi:uncharacterized protein AB675_10760 [Cyphellophora attinorum]|uniref:Uncharacterized protein n=1 Tax=Cyphellophora attinorum TaxID=1664694 RepID=A0A0N1HBG0_9EURO|nr:uncharacterized protein AB675_10760 [Phialophora attinorum]KPI40646.1 hypothetical protein AB675_10760 [Phialophora attinorum]
MSTPFEMPSNGSRGELRGLEVLPEEVLRVILSHVFAVFGRRNDDGTIDHARLRRAEPKYNKGDWYDLIKGDRFMPRYYDLQNAQNLGLDANDSSVLATSQLLNKLGIEVLYGMYDFASYPCETFRALFARHINPRALRAIRSLTFGLPHALKTMPTTFLPRYLRLLADEMPTLATMKMTTGGGGPFRQKVPANQVIEKNRGLLLFAAYVTLRHPGLNFATWHEKGTYLKGHFEFTDRSARIEVIMTAKRPTLHFMEDPNEIEEANDRLARRQEAVKEHEDSFGPFREAFYVLPFCDYEAQLNREAFSHPPGYDVESDYYDEFWDEEGVPVAMSLPVAPTLFLSRPQIIDKEASMEKIIPPHGLLLDSWKIRRTGWEALAEEDKYRPFRYQIPPESNTSEHNTPKDLHSMPFESQCDELLRYNKYPEEAAEKLLLSGDATEEVVEKAREEARERAQQEDANRIDWTYSHLRRNRH